MSYAIDGHAHCMRNTLIILVAVTTLVAAMIMFGPDACQRAVRAPSPGAPLTWDEVSDAIACSERYGGLRIGRQAGLTPLGVGPDSGLWEFLHAPSGSPPGRDPATGSAITTAETGITLVLIPGGTFTMGAQRDDPDGGNYDPQALPDETPHQLTLAPYFIAKTELTQGQWFRLTGQRPSRYNATNRGLDHHPVENITWKDSVQALRDAGLSLPTEAQWEYAARGGTTTAWWCGATSASIETTRAKLLDASAENLPPMEAWDVHVDWDDGCLVHSPVGTSAANPFGLHDMLGNVREWCRDPYAGIRDAGPRWGRPAAGPHGSGRGSSDPRRLLPIRPAAHPIRLPVGNGATSRRSPSQGPRGQAAGRVPNQPKQRHLG